jgi:serine/threonine-protein kinase HipA
MPGDELAIQLQRPDGSWIEAGILSRADDKIWYTMSHGYWDLADRPVLGQVFEEEGRLYQARSSGALPRWFSHVLPEGLPRTAVASAAGVSLHREYDLLARLGHDDLPGAIRAVPRDTPMGGPIPDLDSDEREDEESHEPLLKFSLAGAQLKFSVRADQRGIVVPARGSIGNFIVKFPDLRAGYDGVPEAERGALELARAIGLEVPETFLVDPSDIGGLERWATKVSGPALAIQRFDRIDDDRRIHFEELAQILDVKTGDQPKYRASFENIARTVAALDSPNAVGTVIDRIVLNILVGNGDAHLKNWAFTYPDGNHPRLSPAYDIVPTVLFIPNDHLGPSLDSTKAFESISPNSFKKLGERSGYGADAAIRRARGATARVLDNWELLRGHLSSEQFDRLSRRLLSLRLRRES